ncbi:MAG TPA: asparagine synthetase B, partial [Ferruginibacter sp.]|nr:asparagine synthetase B [Ferruginibacter sp.]
MAHRGPDGEGYAMYQPAAATVGFGHLRLSIIDLSEGGKQPKTFRHLHITFNGEVYNYTEIKKELEKLGHQFDSHSDTEVILHA